MKIKYKYSNAFYESDSLEKVTQSYSDGKKHIIFVDKTVCFYDSYGQFIKLVFEESDWEEIKET